MNTNIFQILHKQNQKIKFLFNACNWNKWSTQIYFPGSINFYAYFFLFFHSHRTALAYLPHAIDANESLDTREGVDLVLKCRFTEHYDAKDFSFYWARWNCCPTQFENVAIGDVQLNMNYR